MIYRILFYEYKTVDPLHLLNVCSCEGGYHTILGTGTNWTSDLVGEKIDIEDVGRFTVASVISTTTLTTIEEIENSFTNKRWYRDFTNYSLGAPVLNKRVESENPGDAGVVVFDNVGLTFYFGESIYLDNNTHVLNPVYSEMNTNFDSRKRFVFSIRVAKDYLQNWADEKQIFEGMVDFSSITYPAYKEENGEYVNSISFEVVDKLSALALIDSSQRQRGEWVDPWSRIPGGYTHGGIWEQLSNGETLSPFIWNYHNFFWAESGYSNFGEELYVNTKVLNPFKEKILIVSGCSITWHYTEVYPDDWRNQAITGMYSCLGPADGQGHVGVTLTTSSIKCYSWSVLEVTTTTNHGLNINDIVYFEDSSIGGVKYKNCSVIEIINGTKFRCYCDNNNGSEDNVNRVIEIVPQIPIIKKGETFTVPYDYPEDNINYDPTLIDDDQLTYFAADSGVVKLYNMGVYLTWIKVVPISDSIGFDFGNFSTQGTSNYGNYKIAPNTYYYKGANYIDMMEADANFHNRLVVKYFNGIKIIESLIHSRWVDITITTRLYDSNGDEYTELKMPITYFALLVNPYPFQQEPLDALMFICNAMLAYVWINKTGDVVVQNRNSFTWDWSGDGHPPWQDIVFTINYRQISVMKKHLFWDKLVDSVRIELTSFIRSMAQVGDTLPAVYEWDGTYLDGLGVVSNTEGLSPRNELTKGIIIGIEDIDAAGYMFDANGVLVEKVVADPFHPFTEAQCLNAVAEYIARLYMNFYGKRRLSYDISVNGITWELLDFEMLDVFDFNGEKYFAVEINYDTGADTLSTVLVGTIGYDYDISTILISKSGDSYSSGGGFNGGGSGSLVGVGSQLDLWGGSTNITKLGIIVIGTWHASVIEGRYGGTGVANVGRTITLAGDLILVNRGAGRNEYFDLTFNIGADTIVQLGGNISTDSVFTLSGAYPLTLILPSEIHATFPTDNNGVYTLVPDVRTLTGIAPILVDGVHTPVDLSADRNINLSRDPSVLGLINNSLTVEVFDNGIKEESPNLKINIDTVIGIVDAQAFSTFVVVVTNGVHNLSVGTYINISGVTGMTDLNGYWIITNIPPGAPDEIYLQVDLITTQTYTGNGIIISTGLDTIQPITVSAVPRFAGMIIQSTNTETPINHIRTLTFDNIEETGSVDFNSGWQNGFGWYLEATVLGGNNVGIDDAVSNTPTNTHVDIETHTVHNYGVGAQITIANVEGMTDLNGYWIVTKINTATNIRVSCKTAQTYSNGGTIVPQRAMNYSLEIDDLTIRGVLSVYELLINQIRAVNGNLLVSSVAVVDSWDSHENEITFKDVTNHGVTPFVENDILMCQIVNLGDIQDSDYLDDYTIVQNHHLVKRLIYRVDEDPVNGLIVHVAEDVNGAPVNVGVPEKGDTFVRIGNVTELNRQGVIGLYADDKYSPYIRITDGVTDWVSWKALGTTKAQMGRIDQIVDSFFGKLEDLGIKYGVYTSSFVGTGDSFFRGTITADSGGFGARGIHHSDGYYVDININGIAVNNVYNYLPGHRGITSYWYDINVDDYKEVFVVGTPSNPLDGDAFYFRLGLSTGNRLEWIEEELSLLGTFRSLLATEQYVGDGFWMQSDGKARFGEVGGKIIKSLTKGIEWDGTDYRLITDNLLITSDESDYWDAVYPFINSAGNAFLDSGKYACTYMSDFTGDGDPTNWNDWIIYDSAGIASVGEWEDIVPNPHNFYMQIHSEQSSNPVPAYTYVKKIIPVGLTSEQLLSIEFNYIVNCDFTDEDINGFPASGIRTCTINIYECDGYGTLGTFLTSYTPVIGILIDKPVLSYIRTSSAYIAFVAKLDVYRDDWNGTDKTAVMNLLLDNITVIKSWFYSELTVDGFISWSAPTRYIQVGQDVFRISGVDLNANDVVIWGNLIVHGNTLIEGESVLIPPGYNPTDWNDAHDKAHTHSNKNILDNIEEALTTALKSNYDDAYSHSLLTSGNPHSVTKTDVGLSNVTNDEQVKSAVNDFVNFGFAGSLSLEDRILIEDYSDGISYTKRYATINELTGLFPVIKYKVYTCLLSQLSTNAPYPDMLLENTYTSSITWSRVGVGHYKIVGDFPIDTTYPYTTDYDKRIMMMIGNDEYAVVGWGAVSGWHENDTTIHIYTQDMDGNPVDNLLSKFPFEIRTYSGIVNTRVINVYDRANVSTNVTVLKETLSNIIVYDTAYVSTNVSVISGAGTNWYVDKDAIGNDDGTSWTDAWISMAHIDWDIISAGDYIYISGGVNGKTYPQWKKNSAWGTFTGTYVTIMGSEETNHNGVVTFYNDSVDDSSSISLVGGSWIQIKNIRVLNPNYTGMNYYAIVLGMIDSILDDLTIEVGANGKYSHCIGLDNCSNIIIRNSVLSVSYNTEQVEQDGICIGNGYGDLLIENNTIHLYGDSDNATHPHRDGIQFWYDGEYAFGTVTIRRNFIYDGCSTGRACAGIYGSGVSGVFNIYNNIIAIGSATGVGSFTSAIGINAGVNASNYLEANIYNNTIITKEIQNYPIEATDCDCVKIKNNIVLGLGTGSSQHIMVLEGSVWSAGDIDYNMVYIHSATAEEYVVGPTGNVSYYSWAEFKDVKYDKSAQSNYNEEHGLWSEASLIDVNSDVANDFYWTNSNVDGISDGVDLSALFTTDYFGYMRSSHDIGAIAYQD